MLDAALLCLLSTFLSHSFGLLEMLWALSKPYKTSQLLGGSAPLQNVGGLEPL